LGLAQAIARRLTTPRGGLFYDSDYGTDIRRWLNAAVQPLGRIGFEVQNEALKDERVKRANATVTIVGGTLNIDLKLVDADGPFTLTLSVNQLTVDIINFQQAA
jgi:hypothetical protein